MAMGELLGGPGRTPQPTGGAGNRQDDSSDKGRWGKDQELQGKGKEERVYTPTPAMIAYVAGHSVEGQTCGAGIAVSGKNGEGWTGSYALGKGTRTAQLARG